MPVDDRGRWRPTGTERLRAAIILTTVLVVLLLIAAASSVGGDADADEEASPTSPSTLGTDDPADEPGRDDDGSDDDGSDGDGATDGGAVDPSSVDGTPPPTRCAADDRGGAPLAEREEVRVVVRNGTGIAGLAAEVSERVDRRGYDTATPGNAPVGGATAVVHAEGRCVEALRLLADLGLSADSVTVSPAGEEPGSEGLLEGADLAVVLGTDDF